MRKTTSIKAEPKSVAADETSKAEAENNHSMIRLRRRGKPEDNPLNERNSQYHKSLTEINHNSNVPKLGLVKVDTQKTDITTHSNPACTKQKKRVCSPSKLEPASKLVKAEIKSEAHSSDSESDSEEELNYEQKRERNMRENQAFFESLGIDKAKLHLQLNGRKVVKPAQRRTPKPEKVVLPRRKSLRIQRIDATGEPLPPQPEPEAVLDEHPRLPDGPVQMLNAIESKINEHTSLLLSLASLTTDSSRHKPTSQLVSCLSDMKKMRISTKAKVCKDRLFSVAIHPTTDKVLAMAGDKWGRLGFWNVGAKNQDGSVVTYRPHSRPIGHIAVPTSDPRSVYTCSYDSTLRLGNFDHGVFDLIYSVPEAEDDLFRNFDFISRSSLLLAQYRGDVSVIDTRTSGRKAEKTYRVCDKYLRTVSVHPTNPHFFVTAGTDMKVSVWDLRKLSTNKGNKPLHSMMHGKSVSSAYFSPLTGARILSCSADDTLNVFNCSSSCGEVTRAKSISHNNKTGRWLTPFRSVWHPSREDVFFVGSMKTPRRIEAFGVDGRLLHSFEGDWLSSVCSVVQFHPSANILVGGNSSGYIFPFM